MIRMKPDHIQSIPLMEISSVTAPDAESMIPWLSPSAVPLINEKTNDRAIIPPKTYAISSS